MLTPASTYPKASDLTEFLTAGKLIESGQTFDTEGAIDAAVADWERDTGWKPFLSTGDDEEREFLVDPGRPDQYLPRLVSRRLFLHAGLLDVTSVKSGTGEDLPSGTWALMPRDGVTLQAPYTDIWVGAHVRSIVINGKWGFCEDLPEDVWRAVLGRAACLVLPQLEFARTSGIMSVQTLASRVTFAGGGGSMYSRSAATFGEDYRAAALHYQLRGMGR